MCKTHTTQELLDIQDHMTSVQLRIKQLEQTLDFLRSQAPPIYYAKMDFSDHESFADFNPNEIIDKLYEDGYTMLNGWQRSIFFNGQEVGVMQKIELEAVPLTYVTLYRELKDAR